MDFKGTLMIDRLIRRLTFERLKLLVKPADALSGKLDFRDVKQHYERQKIELMDAYMRYVQEVSRPDMAISLELASLYSAILEEQKSRKILDLGSGFSSLVSRRFGQTHGASCWSVDDDPAWLQKTINYLQQNNLAQTNCLLLDEFVRSGENEFDMILLDLNFVDVRKNYVRLSVDRCKAGGIILFDDIHKPEYMMEVLKQTSRLPVKLFDVCELTMDRFGRHSLLAVKAG